MRQKQCVESRENQNVRKYFDMSLKNKETN